MAFEGQIYRTIPSYTFNSVLQAVNLGLRVDRTSRTSLDVENEISRSYPFSGTVFLCVEGNIYHYLEEFEGTLVVPPPPLGVPPFYNFELLVKIPNRIHEAWHGGEWFLMLETKVGRTTLVLKSPTYDTIYARRDIVRGRVVTSDTEEDLEDDSSEEQDDEATEFQQQDNPVSIDETLMADDEKIRDQFEESPGPFHGVKTPGVLSPEPESPKSPLHEQQ